MSIVSCSPACLAILINAKRGEPIKELENSVDFSSFGDHKCCISAALVTRLARRAFRFSNHRPERISTFPDLSENGRTGSHAGQADQRGNGGRLAWFVGQLDIRACYYGATSSKSRVLKRSAMMRAAI